MADIIYIYSYWDYNPTYNWVGTTLWELVVWDRSSLDWFKWNIFEQGNQESFFTIQDFGFSGFYNP